MLLAEKLVNDVWHVELGSARRVDEKEIERYEDDASARPDEHGDEPPGAPERAAVFVDDALAEQLDASAPRAPHQGDRYDVLDAGAGVRAREAHQPGQAVREESHENRRHDRQQRERASPQHEVVLVELRRAEEERLQIVPQRDGDDREARGQREHGEQGEEILDELEYRLRLFGTWDEVQRVEVVECGERERPGEREQQVEAPDQDVVGGDQRVQAVLVADRGHEARQRVVAHERVHARAEQRRDAVDIGRRRVALLPVDDQTAHSDAYHDRKRHPPHQNRAHLNVLGLLDVEEGERAEEQDESDQRIAVAVEPRERRQHY